MSINRVSVKGEECLGLVPGFVDYERVCTKRISFCRYVIRPTDFNVRVYVYERKKKEEKKERDHKKEVDREGIER